MVTLLQSYGYKILGSGRVLRARNLRPTHAASVARSEPDGTRRRTGGEVKGKDANGGGSQQPFSVRRNTVYTIAVR